MHRCITSFGSSTARWFLTANRLYSTSTTEPPAGKAVETLIRWTPLTSSSPDNEQNCEWPTSRASTNTDGPPDSSAGPGPQTPTPTAQRQHDLSTNEAATAIDETIVPPAAPYKSRPLPLSPLMDPEVIAAKQKHHLRKKGPSKTPEPLQQQLAKNPYALALATPIRRCQFSDVTLPSFFLQGFNLIAHPETGNPWYLPRSLASKHASTRAGKESCMKAEEADDDDQVEPPMESETKPSLLPDNTPKIGHTAYMLSNKLVIGAMQRKDGFSRPVREKVVRQAIKRGIPTVLHGAHSHLVPNRYRLSKTAAKVFGMASWRPDMNDFVLDLMRRRTVGSLLHLVHVKRGYVVGCSGWECALAKPQVGAYLWTGGDMDEEMKVPPEFATLDVKRGVDGTRKVPVHNLRMLLGKEQLALLREKGPNKIFQNEVLVLKHKNMTVELEMWLWKLQGYLAEYRDAVPELGEEDGEEDVENGEDDFDEADEMDDDEDER